MPKPSEKSSGIEIFLEEMFGRTTAVENMKCVTCSEPADGFRDEVSLKEYTISGMCQSCQDSVFGE